MVKIPIKPGKLKQLISHPINKYKTNQFKIQLKIINILFGFNKIKELKNRKLEKHNQN
jgi:hypothetical protein